MDGQGAAALVLHARMQPEARQQVLEAVHRHHQPRAGRARLAVPEDRPAAADAANGGLHQKVRFRVALADLVEVPAQRVKGRPAGVADLNLELGIPVGAERPAQAVGEGRARDGR
ncbi:hypothetical protein D3C72_1358580 [compost metagenome]